MLIFGWTMLLILGAILIINAAVMLVSPRTWFKLPTWIRAQGTIKRTKKQPRFRCARASLAWCANACSYCLGHL